MEQQELPASSASSPESQPDPNKISPEVLNALGLTQQDVEQFERHRLAEARTLEWIKKSGVDFYATFQPQHDTDTQIELVSEQKLQEAGVETLNQPYVVRIGPYEKKTQIPLLLKRSLDQMQESGGLSDDHFSFIRERGNAFLRGFGNAALKANDWQTAIESYETIDPGNILNNEGAMAKFKEITQNDKTTGIEIARKLQEKINAKPTKPAEQPLRPVPPPEAHS